MAQIDLRDLYLVIIGARQRAKHARVLRHFSETRKDRGMTNLFGLCGGHLQPMNLLVQLVVLVQRDIASPLPPNSRAFRELIANHSHEVRALIRG